MGSTGWLGAAPRVGDRWSGTGAAARPDGVLAFAIDGALQPCGIGPESIVAGTPQARSSVGAVSPDGLLRTGLWDCTAGVLDITFGCDEWVHILEGEVIVHSADRVHRLWPGDVALFCKGLPTRWEIPHYVKKLWVHRCSPRPPLWRRALRKLGGIATASVGWPARRGLNSGL
jgi:uncharacterized cupin superfamily protein